MEKKELSAVRSEIFLRIRSALDDRYGEFVPASLIEDECSKEDITTLFSRIESFRSDEDLIDLFDALKKIYDGNFGRCLFCRSEIAFQRLIENPLVKFCGDCERLLNPRHPSVETFRGENLP